MNYSKQLRNHKLDIIFILVILTFAILPFSNLIQQPGIINSVDANFPLDIEREFFNKLSTWNSNYNFGSDVSLSHLPEITYVFPLYVLNKFLSLESVHRLWFIGIYFIGGISMYFFGKNLSFNKYKEITGLIAGLFFMYNPLQVQYLVHGISPFNFALYLFPLSLLIFIKKFPSNNSNYNIVKNAIIFSLVFSFTQVTLDVQNRILIMYPYLLYAIIRISTSKRKRDDSRYFLLSLIFFFVFNLYWILPSQTTLFGTFELLASEQEIYRDLEGVDLSNLITLSANTSSFRDFYSNVNIMSLGFFLSALIFAAPLAFFRNKTILLPFMIIWIIIFLALALGTNDPFGFIYEEIYNTNFGKIFLPNAANKFEFFLMLPYSFFIGTSISLLIELISNQLKTKLLKSLVYFIVISLAISGFIVYSLPLVDHNKIQNPNFKYLEPVQIPDYYQDTNEWLKKQEANFRVFTVPPPIWRSYSNYDWSIYDMSDITRSALDVPIVMETSYANEIGSLGQNPLIRAIRDIYYHEGIENLSNALRSLNIKYILVRDDLVEPPYGSMGHYAMSSKEPQLEKTANFGKLTLYSINTTTTLSSRIHTADFVVGLVGNVRDMVYLMNYPEFSKSDFYIMKDADEIQKLYDLDKVNWFVIASNPATIRFIDHDTIEVIITRPPTIGSYLFNIYDITKSSAIVTTGFGENTRPFDQIKKTFKISELNVKAASKIEIGDELAIEWNGIISNVVTYQGESTKILPNLGLSQTIKEEIEFGRKNLGYFLPEDYGIINIEIPGEYQVISLKIKELEFELIDEQHLEIKNGKNNRVFLDKGTYFVNVDENLKEDNSYLIYYKGKNYQNNYQIPETKILSDTQFIVYPSVNANFIILTDGFSPGWIAIQEGSRLQHFVINGYANGFYLLNDSPVEINYLPQTIFVYSGIASLFCIFGSISYLLLPRIQLAIHRL